MDKLLKNVDTGLLLAVLGLISIILIGVFFLGTDAPVEKQNDTTGIQENESVKLTHFTVYVEPAEEVQNASHINESKEK